MLQQMPQKLPQVKTQLPQKKEEEGEEPPPENPNIYT
jgi:hypothetical protein